MLETNRNKLPKPNRNEFFRRLRGSFLALAGRWLPDVDFGGVFMRFDLRLLGSTSQGRACFADVSVYANSRDDLMQQAHAAAETAAWQSLEGCSADIPEGETISIEHVELLRKPSSTERD